MSDQLDTKSLREAALGSLYFFAKGVLGYDWLTPTVHLPVCEHLSNPCTNRKLIELPRGWLKTTICSVAYPIWCSLHDPNIRILIVQNTMTNAMRKLSTIRKHWESNALLRLLFPELVPTPDSVWKSDSVCLNRTAFYPESTYECAGVSTAVVSRHYNIIIEDDTVSPDFDELGGEALAPTHDQVEKAIGWHRTNVLPLLNNPTIDKSIVVGTRWYERDLIAYIKESEPEYAIYSRACRENERGEPDPQGKVVYPERFDAQVLESLERSLGPYMFSCLYMNQPIRQKDMLFRSEWFKFYDTPPPLRSMLIYTTVDFATDPDLARSTDIDYTVVMTCGKEISTGVVYVLDYTRFRGSPGEIINEIFTHVERYKPLVLGYDDTAFQRAIEYFVKEQMRRRELYFVMTPIRRQGRGAKEKAISALQPLFASGTILIRSHMRELMSELLRFPSGSHDDVADALAMQMGLWKSTARFAGGGESNDDQLFSVDRAIKEIRSKESLSRGGLIFDPATCLSSSDFRTEFMAN